MDSSKLQINELAGILNQHFSWNKARMDCFVGMLIGLLKTRTINLVEMSMGFASDAGKGPPSGLVGWIRTGFYSNGSSGTWGYDNCTVWTSKSSLEKGAVVYLQAEWSNAGNTFGWSGANWDCDAINARVWCVED